tara:strand:- start:1405 stop:3093 length:1689 start_codon:yes stop_codon:yes gene_type:complete
VERLTEGLKTMGLKDKGTLLYKTNCPECGSSDANQVYGHEDGTTDTYCFACQAYDFKDKTTKRLSNKAEDDRVEMKDIDSLPSLGIRSVKDAVASLFGVKVGFSPNDGKTITKQFYPTTREGQIVGYEERNVLSKAFTSIGDRKGSVELFGTALAKRNGYKNLFITEGCLDAMSLYQVIIENTPAKFKEFKPSVVSLTRGVTSGLKDLINNKDFIDKYDNVTLVLDNDSAGLKAQSEILKTFHNFKVAELPLKDANAMLEAGKGKELYTACMWNAKHVRQGEVVEIDDKFIKSILEKPVMGLSTCWKSYDKLTYGIRPHTIVTLGSYPKAGKSIFKTMLVHHLISHHKRPVGVYDLEVHPRNTIKQIASHEAGVNFLRPDVEYEDDVLLKSLEIFNSKLYLYDRTGSRDWDDIKSCIVEQHLLDGVCEFFIDPLTALISRFDSSSANDKLNEIMTDIADLVNLYPITIFLFSHVNSPKTGKSHEEGGRILSSQFTGSRSMERWGHIGLGLERDRSDSCPEDKVNVSKIVLLFDRDFGNSGSFELRYDPDTTRYLEMDNRYGR